MASIDRPAAQLLRELRTDAGLSPEALSQAMLMQGLGYVSGKTIRRIEHTGKIPTPRVQFSIARYFDRLPSGIWAPRARGGRGALPPVAHVEQVAA